jgi:ketosteroid isomerase-like protein
MRTLGVMLLVAAFATAAFGDATTTARTHSEAFGKACSAGDIKAVMALYTDDAFVIWPGAGEEARGKAAIEKLATGLCDPKLATKAVPTSVVGVLLDPTHIAVMGHWDFTQNGPDGKPTTSQIRTSEIIRKSAAHGWRYLVDHASIGMPPPAPAK